MNIGIPGLSDREFMMSVWILVLAAVGGAGSYVFHKSTGKGIGTITLKSFVIYAFTGLVAGFILVAFTKGGAGIGHYDIIPIALSWGASWQYVLGKYLGWREIKKATLVETMAPEEKKEPEKTE